MNNGLLFTLKVTGMTRINQIGIRAAITSEIMLILIAKNKQLEIEQSHSGKRCNFLVPPVMRDHYFHLMLDARMCHGFDHTNL